MACLDLSGRYAGQLRRKPRATSALGAFTSSAWRALGATEAERTAAYRCLLDEALLDDLIAEVRHYLQQQRAWGRDDFCAMIEAKTHRFAGTRPAHRPRKTTSLDK
ncbi:MAG TPA: transposase [Luteimonas sp.]|nr:transposase [Luteimonas sp.]